MMMRTSAGTTWMVLLCAGLAVAGCKSKGESGAAQGSAANPPPTSAAATSSSDPDACALLTTAEAKELTGRDVTTTGHGSTGRPNVCEYEFADGGQIMTSMYATAGRQTFEAAPGDAMPGVGDQAKWIANANMLAVLKGEVSFTVGLVLLDDTTPEKALEQVKALAAKMLTRL